ncbi:glucosamine-6-phosphate deaminase [Domibacillus indicus]|uniref:glucosamine-6-phosphate deaminase n=1 Tax=Domibacillus indicus TaxID=1437523 RepID=UPI00203E3224|nr:glucosamine-6-phosphate deaminase [Domibacillus indicus]MCM3789983.1 glucosamine-6-phosphate deaminase [Domibacillus indicus]
MKLIITDDYKALSVASAKMVADTINQKQTTVLGLATGSTPVGLYQELISLYINKQVDFSHVTTFNLDEYVGLSPGHPQSYHKFMYDNFFNHVNISQENIHIPKGDNPELEEECAQYEEKIESVGQIDIQVLGIGENGHIGFNEPGSDPNGCTSLVKLSESTVEANARFFGDKELVPRLAISMGLKTILDSSKHVLLLASGEKKAGALYQMVYGEVSEDVPATFLQHHRNVTVIADKDAAKKLPKSDLIAGL